MIRSLFLSIRERWWDRDRRRQIKKMVRLETADDLADLVEGMAIQLAEILALPEVLEQHRGGGQRA